MTLQASFGRGEGVGFEAQLPLGVIRRSDLVTEAQADFGAGDLEVRGRYAARFSRLSIRGTAGLALPTGRYAARSGAIAILENARYLTLGRGTTWAIGDLDVRFALPSVFKLFATSALRVALGDTRDGFRWGPELRGVVGVAAGPLAERLSLSLGLEAQWRAQSSEIDPFTEERAASVNTGGVWMTVLPSVQVRIVDALTAFAAVRIPVWQRTEGLQFIPATGAFLGVAGTWEVISPAPVAVTPSSGRVTVVDYWATWCEPCKRLEPIVAKLEQLPSVTVKRVDCSALSADELDALVPGAAGLPIVEVFNPDGSKRRRLVGEEVFEVESIVQEALK